MHIAGNVRSISLWVCSFLICIAPALVNGFPFHVPDSLSYDGRGIGNSLRSSVPSVIAHPLYLFVGPWSLVIINSMVFSFLLIRLRRVYFAQVPSWLTLFLTAISLVPLFSSVILVDIWALFLAMAFLKLWKGGFSWFEFVITICACASHGSHQFIFAASLLAIWITSMVLKHSRCLMNLNILLAGVAILVSGVLLDLMSSSLLSNMTRLSTATIASKVMSDVPDAFDAFCQQQSSHPNCQMLSYVHSIPRREDDDGQYLWKLYAEGVPLDSLNKFGFELGVFVMKHYPLQYIWESLQDFARLMTVKYDGLMFLSYDRGYGNSRATLTRSGVFSHEIAHFAIIFINGALILSAVVLLGVLALKRGPLLIESLFCTYFFIANDLFFAFTSGTYSRYHLRLLFLPALVVLFATSVLYSDASVLKLRDCRALHRYKLSVLRYMHIFGAAVI